MQRFTHVGPCLVHMRDNDLRRQYDPIIVAQGEHLIEQYELIRPDKIGVGPEYTMYRSSPPPWMRE